jgi:hypothetical protein
VLSPRDNCLVVLITDAKKALEDMVTEVNEL